MSETYWILLVIGAFLTGLLVRHVPYFSWRPRREDPEAKRMLEGITRTNQLLEQLQAAAWAHEDSPGPAVSASPCMCHILWHASDASDVVDPEAMTNIHLLTFTDREERIWIDARDPIRVKFLDMDPTCFADAAEMSDTATLRVFADYHVDVHYPETREWMRQAMRRCPQGAFVFQVPADNIVVGGIVFMRDGVLQPLSPGERTRVNRIFRRAHLRPCSEAEARGADVDLACAEGRAVIADVVHG